MTEAAVDTPGQAPADSGTGTQQQQAAPVAAPVDTGTAAPGATGTEAPAGGEGGGAGEGNQGAPGEYADFAMPEGMAMDAAHATDLKSLAKEFGLTQAQAQKVADLGAKWATDLSGKQAQALEDMSNAWEQAAQTDKEIGGDKLPENLGFAKSALAKFGNPQLSQLLESSRLGSHPDVIRMLAAVGRAMADDKVLTGAAPGQAPSTAELFYGGKK
jgi:hypothetical protein